MGTMPTAVLILPSATYRAADFLAAAATLHADVVVASEGVQALAGEMGDRFVRIDCARPAWSAERIAALAERRPVDAVVAADDQGVEVAARAAARLGLPHNPPDAVGATRDKAELRRRLAAAGVRQPRFALLPPGTGLAGLSFPVVVKPRTLSASRGVIRGDDPAALEAAVTRIRTLLADPEATLLVEEFVPGPEFAIEGLVTGGRLDVLAIFDKPDPLDGPYFEETLLVSPARVDPAGQAALESTAATAVAALGLTHGPVHAELRLSAGEAVVLEVAARSIGGLCGRALRFGLLGESLETVLLRHALGFPPRRPRPQAPAAGAMMLPIPEAGVLREVGGVAAARAVPGIVDLEITIGPGRPVVPLPEGDRYLGFLVARGARPDDVEAALREAHRRLDVVIDPA